MKKYFTAFMMAWGNFLSIPCPKKIWDNNLKKEMLSLLPIIGLIVGVLSYAISYVLRILNFPIAVTAFLMTLFVFGISGFMHADGFMDCCDAILSRRELAERQRILKDSRVGAFAVISMILMAIGTFAAFVAIAERHMATAAISFTTASKLSTLIIPLGVILIPVLSRSISGLSVLTKKPLETSQYAGEETTRKEASKSKNLLALSTLIIYAVVVIVEIVLASKLSKDAIMPNLLPIAVSSVATIYATDLFARLARKNLGGMSGDIAGFAICMGELIGFLALALALHFTW